MTGGESEEERSLYLLAISLCVSEAVRSLLFLEFEASVFWVGEVS